MIIKPHPKVAIFTLPDMAGAENMLYRFIADTDSDFKKNFVLIFPKKGEFSYLCEEIGIQYRIIEYAPIKPNPLKYIKCLVVLTRFLKNKKFDLLDCNNLTLTQVCAPLAIMLRLPLVVHAHDAFTGKLTLLILRYLSKLSGFRLVAVSGFVRNKFIEYGVNEASIATIYNGIRAQLSISDDKSNTNIFRKQYNFSKADILIAIIGRLTQWKRQHLFIEAAKHFASNHSIKFVIIGDGRLSMDRDYSRILHRAVRKASLNNVNFLGWISDVNGILTDIDIVVSISKDEPFGLTMIEAMVNKVPLIGVRSGAIPELIIDKYNGLLIELDNVPQLIKSINDLIFNKMVRRKYGENGYQLAMSKFSIENHVEGILKMYREMYY